ncbi:MAG: hypothetical protein ACOZBH_01955 [Patescibacteria group bacterium]
MPRFRFDDEDGLKRAGQPEATVDQGQLEHDTQPEMKAVVADPSTTSETAVVLDAPAPAVVSALAAIDPNSSEFLDLEITQEIVDNWQGNCPKEDCDGKLILLAEGKKDQPAIYICSQRRCGFNVKIGEKMHQAFIKNGQDCPVCGHRMVKYENTEGESGHYCLYCVRKKYEAMMTEQAAEVNHPGNSHPVDKTDNVEEPPVDRAMPAAQEPEAAPAITDISDEDVLASIDVGSSSPGPGMTHATDAEAAVPNIVVDVGPAERMPSGNSGAAAPAPSSADAPELLEIKKALEVMKDIRQGLITMKRDMSKGMSVEIDAKLEAVEQRLLGMINKKDDKLRDLQQSFDQLIQQMHELEQRLADEAAFFAREPSDQRSEAVVLGESLARSHKRHSYYLMSLAAGLTFVIVWLIFGAYLSDKRYNELVTETRKNRDLPTTTEPDWDKFWGECSQSANCRKLIDQTVGRSIDASRIEANIRAQSIADIERECDVMSLLFIDNDRLNYAALSNRLSQLESKNWSECCFSPAPTASQSWSAGQSEAPAPVSMPVSRPENRAHPLIRQPDSPRISSGKKPVVISGKKPFDGIVNGVRVRYKCEGLGCDQQMITVNPPSRK